MSGEFGDPEIRDAIRDLCLAVAELAVCPCPACAEWGVVHEIGITRVQSVLNKVGRLSALMDREDGIEARGGDR